MNEPWKDSPKIWEAFCKERECHFGSEEVKLLFTNTRSIKEEYEWFKLGYMKGASVS